MGILLSDFFIVKLFGNIMGLIYKLLSSINLNSSVYSIILFTIIVYTLMLPLTIKQQKFTKISAVMNPEIQKIQEKYKGKRDQASLLKQQDEMRAVYAKYGTSTAGGCLVSLVQLPILFCLWPVISNIEKYIDPVEGYQKFLIFKNISVSPSQAIKEAGKAGLLISIAAAMIPLLSGFTQWLSMKISQNATQNNKDGKKDENAMAAQMNVMMKWMPIFSVLMCFSMPMGLGIYWIVSAVIRIIQQICINNHLNKKSIGDLIEENAKKLEKKNEKKKKASSESMNSMAKLYTRRLEEMKAEVYADAEKREKEQQRRKELIEKSNGNSNPKPGSLAAKANMVRDYNNNHK